MFFRYELVSQFSHRFRRFLWNQTSQKKKISTSWKDWEGFERLLSGPCSSSSESSISNFTGSLSRHGVTIAVVSGSGPRFVDFMNCTIKFFLFSQTNQKGNRKFSEKIRYENREKQKLLIQEFGDSENPRGKCLAIFLTVLEREGGGLDGEHVSFWMAVR